MTTDWSGALQDFGRALLRFEEGLELEPPDEVSFAFEFPSDLGPLPPDLLGVATRLADMSARMEDHIRRLLGEIVREQTAVTRARSNAVQERPRAHFVDIST